MKKIGWIIIVIILVLINLLSIYNNRVSQNENVRLESKILLIERDLNLAIDFYRENLLHSYSTTDQLIGETEFIDIKEFDTVKLGDISHNKPILFFCFDDNHCITCIEEELKRLRYSNIPFKVMGNYGTLRDFIVLLQNNEINNDAFYNLENILEPTDYFKDNPYFFVLHPGGRVTHLYFRSDHSKEFTNKYLSIIQNYYLED